MFTPSDLAVADNYFLKPGYILVPKGPTIIAAVLGSCVAVCLYDRKRECGGMNHFQLPSTNKLKEATARYGNVATLALIGMMINEGSKIKNLEAQIFGGGHNAKTCPRNIGLENVRIARMILTRKHIRIASEDVGGEKGRKVVFNTASDEIAIVKVDKIRQGDWYPFIDNR